MAAYAPVAALLLSVALLLMGNGLQSTLLPVRAHLEGFGTFQLGALGSAYFLGFVLGCLLGPPVVRRVGHVRVFLVMSAVASAVPLVHALAVTPATWLLARGVTGLCLAVLYVVIESWLNDFSTNETRGRVLSLYLAINLTVITIGQMMLVLYDPASFELFILAAILVSLAAIPVGLTRATTPALPDAVHVRLRRLYRYSPVGMVGCVCVGLSNGSFWALAPLFATEAGLDVIGLALFMSVAVIAGAASQWPLGRLSDRTDRRKVIVAVCVGAAGAGVALGLAGLSGTALIALGAAFGVFAFPLYAVSVAHANDFVPREDMVEVSSGLLLMFGAGAIGGPLVASGVVALVGAGGLFFATAAVHLGLAGYALWRIRQRAPAPESDRVAFAASAQAAQTVSTTFEPPAPDAAGRGERPRVDGAPTRS